MNINIPEFQFWSYNLHGFISDLYLILYDDNKYPWYDIKYIKRFERLFILGIYQLLFINNENLNQIQTNQQQNVNQNIAVQAFPQSMNIQGLPNGFDKGVGGSNPVLSSIN